MTPKICVSLTAHTNCKLSDMLLKSEKKGADLIEIRLDYFKEIPNFIKIRKMTSLPLIATNRSQSEGGFYDDIEEKRLRVLFTAASEGFEYIDLELMTPSIQSITKKMKKEYKIKLIISYHNYKSTPRLAHLNQIFKEQVDVGANLCKIVPLATTLEDNLTCLQFVSQASKINNIICFCMGTNGILSRLFSPLFGGYMTYASIEKRMEAASGQLTLEETRNFYELITL